MPATPDELTVRLQRLRQLIQEVSDRTAGPAPPNYPIASPWHLPDQESLPIEELVQGEEVAAADTTCFVRRSTFGATQLHGRYSLDLALAVSNASLDWLAGATLLDCSDLSEALFLDIETTGLSGGPGTLAFLVGAAWFAGDCLEVSQFLMRGPHEEPAMLELLSQVAQDRRIIVSFNGRSFDVPILETRFTMARRRCPLPQDHVDLLTGARRVWRARLTSCRLSHLEEHVLGVERADDVPGWLVPQLYFAYLRTGDARGLVSVFEHNLLDVLSLVTLAGRLGALHHQPQLALEDDPLDLAALGRAFEKWPRQSDDSDRTVSCDCYELALRHGLKGPDAALTKMRLALAHKSHGQWAQAVGHWQDLAGSAQTAIRLAACLELAKHAEHQLRDYATALSWAEQASGLAGHSDTLHDRICHRIARLQRRLNSQGTGIASSQQA